MTIAEEIFEQVKRAPQPIQNEVLHFVQFLLTKSELWSDNADSQSDWFKASLEYAMRDMEDEDTPVYTVADLKEKYS